MPHDYQDDIDAVNRISAVPTILDVVCRVTGMGFAAVARVTDDRWITCAVRDDIAFGLVPGSELPVSTTICDEIRDSRQGVAIDHVDVDPKFRTHHTPLTYGFQSYISMPIIREDGSVFGTLCSIDPRPARLDNPQIIGMFQLFAQLIAAQLDADDKLALVSHSLSAQRREAELREQFIAVLGHDLRNPIAALDAGTKLLGREMPSPRAANILGMMRNTVLRMQGLVENVLDFARGRLGDGIQLHRNAEPSIEAPLEQVVEEMRSANPERAIVTDFHIDGPVYADRQRIAQLFANLLGNAVTHGDPAQPVQVSAGTADGVFTLTVTNGGDPIPEKELAGLFQPFKRGAHGGDGAGLGLGLYIAAQIAEAHGGALTVSSTAERTSFTFTMPTDTRAEASPAPPPLVTAPAAPGPSA